MGQPCQGGAGELAPSTVCSEPTAKQSQTFLLPHTAKREEEGSVMQENEILHQQLVQLPGI